AHERAVEQRNEQNREELRQKIKAVLCPPEEESGECPSPGTATSNRRQRKMKSKRRRSSKASSPADSPSGECPSSGTATPNHRQRRTKPKRRSSRPPPRGDSAAAPSDLVTEPDAPIPAEPTNGDVAPDTSPVQDPPSPCGADLPSVNSDFPHKPDFSSS